MQIDLEKLLPWSDPKEVMTAVGPRIVRSAYADGNFWDLRNRDREAFRAAGISIKKEVKGKEEAWLVSWWQLLPDSVLQEKKRAVEASRATGADFDYPVPPGLSYLPYQVAGIAYAREHPGTLLADEMGLGKTIQIIGLINSDPKIHRVCIICPAGLKINWFRELSKWLVRKVSIGIAESDCFPTTDIVIINYDIVHKFEKSLTFYWDLLAVDEAHYLKNRKARRTKFILGYKPTKKEKQKAEKEGKTLEPMSPIPARRRVFATGTPICNEPAELWPLISVLDPKTWDNFFKFATRYCGMKQGSWGWEMAGPSNLDELQTRLRESCMVRRLKADVLKELPPKRRQIIELPSDGIAAVRAERAAVEEIGLAEKMAELEAAVELAKASDDPAIYAKAVERMQEGVSVSFEQIAKLRHDTAVAKAPLLIDPVRDAMEQGKVILFCHHKDVVAIFEQAFAGECVKVVGGMESGQKMAAVDKFMRDPKCRLFIGALHAAGVGLTLTVSSHVIFAEEDWRPDIISQCEDRAHRIGQLESVLVQHYVLAGSLDANMVRTTLAKQQIIEKALNAISASEGAEMAGSRVTTLNLPDREKAKRTAMLKTSIAEPVPLSGGVRVEVAEYEAELPLLTDAQIKQIHYGLQMLSGVCDGAGKLDGAGFSKIDARIGHSLANQSRISPRQAVLGRRLCIKYRRQLGDAFVEKIK